MYMVVNNQYDMPIHVLSWHSGIPGSKGEAWQVYGTDAFEMHCLAGSTVRLSSQTAIGLTQPAPVKSRRVRLRVQALPLPSQILLSKELLLSEKKGRGVY